MSLRRIVDLSQPVGPDTPVFPGDGPVRVDVMDVQDQSAMNLSRIELSVHTGTHMDRVPLERCMGAAALIDLRGIPAGSEIRLDQIESRREALRHAHLAVLHTGWSKEWGSQRYFRDHPRLSGAAAQFLVDAGVELTGVDMPSVDQAPYPAHKVLLSAGVLIVENLTNLEAIGADLFELIVLPLRLAGRDGSPVRAVALF
jgi:arylformamidase